MEKELKIDTNTKKFFRQYVEILQPFIKLRANEADVLAGLLYHSYLRKDIGNLIDRFKLVFDYDTRLKIQEELNMSTPVFRNCLSRLRKKKIIGEHNVIPPYYLVNPTEENFSIKYTFTFKN